MHDQSPVTTHFLTGSRIPHSKKAARAVRSGYQSVHFLGGREARAAGLFVPLASVTAPILRRLFMLRAQNRRLAALLKARPRIEILEDRCLLSANVLQTNLVSDLPGVAQVQDPHLVNPWGISESAASPFWISDNNAGASTLYNGQGQPQPPGANPPKTPLIVSIPGPGDLRSGHLDVVDTKFGAVTLPRGAFTDPDLPKGYAPFNVQELGGKVYVTYAKQDKDKHDDVAGPGHGFVDVYNLDGSGEQRL